MIYICFVLELFLTAFRRDSKMLRIFSFIGYRRMALPNRLLPHVNMRRILLCKPALLNARWKSSGLDSCLFIKVLIALQGLF